MNLKTIIFVMFFYIFYVSTASSEYVAGQGTVMREPCPYTSASMCHTWCPEQYGTGYGERRCKLMGIDMDGYCCADAIARNITDFCRCSDSDQITARGDEYAYEIIEDDDRYLYKCGGIYSACFCEAAYYGKTVSIDYEKPSNCTKCPCASDMYSADGVQLCGRTYADYKAAGVSTTITDCKILPTDASDIAYADDTGSFTLNAPCEYTE